MHVITLVAAAPPLPADVMAGVRRTLGAVGTIMWLAPGRAAEFAIDAPPAPPLIRELRARLEPAQVDLFVTPQDNRRKKLLLADMDATIVAGETLDEIAARVGIGDEVAAITARAMNGELDFRQALAERVALLAGKPAALLQQVLDSGSLNPGAETLVRTMKRHGAKTVLVSGGFTFFTAAYAAKAGFDHHHGNTLEIAGGLLTGHVMEPVLDKDSKRAYLADYCAQHGLPDGMALALGDGANDLPMLTAAGLGLGYCPKKIVEDALDNCILHNDLTAALFAQGYKEDEFYH